MAIDFRPYLGRIDNFLIAECGFRKGKKRGLVCPAHDNDRNGEGYNVSVNVEAGTWHCFHCGAGGSYVEAYAHGNNVPQKEAFRILLRKAGISGNGKTAKLSRKEIRQEAAEEAYRLLMAHKNESAYASAYKYLLSRGFTDETLRRYKIGFQSGWELVKALEEKGVSKDAMKEAGLIGVSRKGNEYPCFMSRVTMMVGDNLYGRAIDPNQRLRHLYTRDTNSLFGEAQMEAKARDIIFVVEAAFDALTIEQYIRNLGLNACCVATCGTKGMKPEILAEKLSAVSPAEVIIIPDEDPWQSESGCRHAAGQRAGLQKARELEKKGVPTRMLVLPDNSDPNDLSKRGVKAEEFLKLVKRAISPARFAIYCEAHYHDLKKEPLGFFNMVKKSLAVHHVPLRTELVSYLSLLTGIKEKEVRHYFAPELDKASALDYIRAQVKQGKGIDEVLEELRKEVS